MGGAAAADATALFALTRPSESASISRPRDYPRPISESRRVNRPRDKERRGGSSFAELDLAASFELTFIKNQGVDGLLTSKIKDCFYELFTIFSCEVGLAFEMK